MEREEKKRRSSLLLCLLVIIAIVQSCVKDEYRLDEVQITQLSPEFAIPLAHTTMDMWDIADGITSADAVNMEEGQVISLSFEKQLFDIGISDLVDLEELNYQDAFTADATTALILNAAPAGTVIPYAEEFVITMDAGTDVDLDSILFDSALLQVGINSTFRHDIRIDMSIPQLVSNGEALVQTVDLDYMGSLPVSTGSDIDLDEYTLDLSQATNPNEFTIVLDMEVTLSGELTSEGDMIEFEFILGSDQVESVHGYFGQNVVVSEPDTQQVEVFDAINADQFYFAEPTIELSIDNSAGVPIYVEFTSLYAPENATFQEITGGALQDIPVIQAAPAIGESTVTQHVIDNSNTSPQLSDMISEGPADLIYSPLGMINPEGLADNFLSKDSRITCDALINLPLHGFVDGYSMIDTLAIDIETDLGLSEEGSLTIDDIRQVTFRIVADNGLPLEADLQVYFLDADGLIQDSLFTSEENDFSLEPALIEESLAENHPDQGKVIASTRTIIDAPMSKERLEELSSGEIESMIVNVLASTHEASSGTMVKILPEDSMEISISVKLETEIDLND